MERETRSLGEVHADESRRVEGLGIVFNSESKDLGGFQEIIRPEAIKGVLERSDVLALVNHDVGKGVLARCTNGIGSLDLQVNRSGVKYSFIAPHTTLGDEVVEGIRRGDIRTSSFAFSVAPDGEKWEKRSNGLPLRTITKFDNIYDVSAVYREAYEETSVALRSLNAFTNRKEVDETKRSDYNIIHDMTPSQRFEYEKYLDHKRRAEADEKKI